MGGMKGLMGGRGGGGGGGGGGIDFGRVSWHSLSFWYNKLDESMKPCLPALTRYYWIKQRGEGSAVDSHQKYPDATD
jgi:hypothetical protein